MKYCTNCGKELADNAQTCPNCGYVFAGAQVAPSVVATGGTGVADKPAIFLNIVSFFIPLVGLILYFSWRHATPRRAKSVLIAALIGIIFNSIVISQF